MEASAAKEWYLRKHEDGRIFGPLTFDQLERWASSAQIAPHDLISPDQLAWMKAPMLPELHMDWLVEITSDQLYGPTTVGAIEDFIRVGEINQETWVINATDGSRHQLADLPAIFRKEPPAVSEEAPTGNAPQATTISVDVSERIRSLEASLREERRALAEAEQRYRELAERHEELIREVAASSPPPR